MRFDYYYGVEAEQFSFYRVPRLLIKDERFKGLSSDAKLLYGLMLDRMSLSMKNGWLDDENRAYIIYTIDNICPIFIIQPPIFHGQRHPVKHQPIQELSIAAKPLETLVFNQQAWNTVKRKLLCFYAIVIIKLQWLTHFTTS